MSIDLSRQTIEFFCSAILGIILGILYDMGRALRREHPRLTIPVDILFGLIFFLAMWLTSIYTRGLRIYQCLGVFLGSGLYFLTVSIYLVRLWRCVLQHLQHFVRIIFLPAKKSLFFLRKLVKKLFPSSGKWGTIKVVPFSPKRHRKKERQP